MGMEPVMIGVLGFFGLLFAIVILACICFFCSSKKKKSAHSPITGPIDEHSGQPTSNVNTASMEMTDIPLPTLPHHSAYRPYKSGSGERFSTTTTAIKTKSTMSQPEKSLMENGRLRIKHFKYVGTHKRFTRITDGPLVHSFTNISRKHSPVTKILTREIKGEIMLYSADFALSMPLVAARSKKAEILDQFYHLGMPVMDQNEYRRKRFESLNILELCPVEGNHEKVKNLVEGTPFLEIKPHLAKMPAKRDDTIRHFILNTQYASRLAVRFVCASGRFVSIPSHEIIEPCGRLRVVIVANSDMEDAPEKETIYYEYIQVPERAMDAHHEFMKRPVIGRITLRLFPNILNLSPNTFYPSARRKTTVYTSTLTNTGKLPCKFAWPDERNVIVSPQNGYIKPHSSVQFTFTPKRPPTTHALVAEMKYCMNDKPITGSMTVRFETDGMKRLIQLSTKALAACDTAEDPGYFG